MRYYLDTQIVIYAVEGLPPFQQRAQSHITALEAAGHRLVVSDLTRTECLVKPFEPGNDRLLREFFRFFHNQALQTVNLSAATHERAAMIRAVCKYPAPDPTVKPRRYSLADSLHLAAAIEAGCDCLLTNDLRLAGFPDIVVEVLP